MAYVDADTVHVPEAGLVVPSFWGDVVRDDLTALNSVPAFFGNGSISAQESTTTNTHHIFDIPVERFDSDGMHSAVTNTSRVTIQTPGKYLIVVTTWWSVNLVGVRASRLRYNGVTMYLGEQHNAGYAEHASVCSVFDIYLDAGDYVEPAGTQNTGSNLNAFLKQFGVIWVSR